MDSATMSRFANIEQRLQKWEKKVFGQEKEPEKKPEGEAKTDGKLAKKAGFLGLFWRK